MVVLVCNYSTVLELCFVPNKSSECVVLFSTSLANTSTPYVRLLRVKQQTI